MSAMIQFALKILVVNIFLVVHLTFKVRSVMLDVSALGWHYLPHAFLFKIYTGGNAEIIEFHIGQECLDIHYV